MKIVHTYIPTKNGGTLNRYTAYCMLLSTLLAKKHHEHVFLYTNKEIEKIVKKIGIPYNVIDTEVLEGVEVKTFSVPKLMVYTKQTQPYLHIDLDSFIYQPIEVKLVDRIYSSFAEGSSNVLSFERNNSVFFKTYLKGAFEIQDKLPEEFLEYVKFQNIPNMSIFGGHSWKLIAEATEYCLKIYEDNKEFFDSNYYNACIIEQLFIPAAIRMILDRENEEIVMEKDIFNFIFDKNPTVIEFTGEKWDYPFIIESNADVLKIESQTDLFRNLNYNFNGFLHLNGYKTFDEVIFMIRQRIIDEFGGNHYINKIDKLFTEETKTDKIFDSYCDYLRINLDKMVSMKNKSFGLI